VQHVKQVCNPEALQPFHRLSHEAEAPAFMLLAHHDHRGSCVCHAGFKRAEQRQTDIGISNSPEYSSKLSESTANIVHASPAFLLFDKRDQFANAARRNPGVVDAVRIAVEHGNKVVA
jgi:hypothetical protein